MNLLKKISMNILHTEEFASRGECLPKSTELFILSYHDLHLRSERVSDK